MFLMVEFTGNDIYGFCVRLKVLCIYIFGVMDVIYDAEYLRYD